MAVRQVLLIELFTIVVVLYGGFSVISPELNSNPSYPAADLYLGVLGLVSGIIGSLIQTAFETRHKRAQPFS